MKTFAGYLTVLINLAQVTVGDTFPNATGGVLPPFINGTGGFGNGTINGTNHTTTIITTATTTNATTIEVPTGTTTTPTGTTTTPTGTTTTPTGGAVFGFVGNQQELVLAGLVFCGAMLL